jgi:nitrate reductase gamma subunit
MTILQLSIYASLLIFLLGIVIRIVKITRMPIHLRWDLYPIPHEKGKAHYGGSRYEEPNWWTRPLAFSRTGELAEMAREIFAIKTLHRNNRKLWYFSLPFHWGLYSLTICIVLLIIGALFEIGGLDISANSVSPFGKFYGLLIATFGLLGWSLGLFGALGILVTRSFSNEYRKFTLLSDYFNLFLLIALFVAGLSVWASVDRSYYFHRALAHNLVAFKPIGDLPFMLKIELGLSAFFFAYLPFTHMTHFVGKFFTFHKVRWQDEANAPGSKLEHDVIDALGEKVSWKAPHMSSGKTWAQGTSSDREELGD